MIDYHHQPFILLVTENNIKSIQFLVMKETCRASAFNAGFSLGHLHMGGGGGQVQGDNIDLMGGPNFDRLYHQLKVFIGYDSIKTH